jgi:hypothetical protein
MNELIEKARDLLGEIRQEISICSRILSSKPGLIALKSGNIE